MAATSKEQVFDKGIRQKWTLFAVPIVRNHLAVVELTPRSKCVYTRHPDLCHATSGMLTSQPPEHAKIGMRVKTLSDRRHNKILRVNTASGANWLIIDFSFHSLYTDSRHWWLVDHWVATRLFSPAPPYRIARIFADKWGGGGKGVKCNTSKLFCAACTESQNRAAAFFSPKSEIFGRRVRSCELFFIYFPIDCMVCSPNVLFSQRKPQSGFVTTSSKQTIWRCLPLTALLRLPDTVQ